MVSKFTSLFLPAQGVRGFTLIDLLDGSWAQVSLIPAGMRLQLSRILEFSSPIDRRFKELELDMR